MVLLGRSEAGHVRPTGQVGRVVGFVDDLGAAGGVALSDRVLEGEGAVGTLFLYVGAVCSVLTGWLPLN